MKVTMELIEQKMDHATRQAERFADGDISLQQFNEAIEELTVVFRKGIEINLRCIAQRIEDKLRTLESIVKPLMAEGRI